VNFVVKFILGTLQSFCKTRLTTRGSGNILKNGVGGESRWPFWKPERISSKSNEQRNKS